MTGEMPQWLRVPEFGSHHPHWVALNLLYPRILNTLFWCQISNGDLHTQHRQTYKHFFLSQLYLGVVPQACNPSTWEAETKGLEVQGHVWLIRELETSQGYRDPASKDQNEKHISCLVRLPSKALGSQALFSSKTGF